MDRSAIETTTMCCGRPHDAAVGSALQTEVDLLKVHVARFGTTLPNPICIARIMPRGVSLPHLKILAPSQELLAWWRRSDKSEQAWRIYASKFWAEIAARCKANPWLWNQAKMLVSDGTATDMRGACLAVILQVAAQRLEVDEITLCCYESPDDPHCHRKLIYDGLPESMKGNRG